MTPTETELPDLVAQRQRLTALIETLHVQDLEVVEAYSGISQTLLCGTPKAGTLLRRIASGRLLANMDPAPAQPGGFLSEKQARRIRRLIRRHGDFRRDCVALLEGHLADGRFLPLRYRRLSQEMLELIAFIEDMKSDVWDLYAATDELTGLLNRTALERIAQEEIRRSRRSGAPLCLAILDADRFKAVNDAHGHDAGDEVLVELARRVDDNLRAHDHVFRYGGEEILILMPRTGWRQAATILDRVRRAVAADPIPLATGEALTATVSIGYSELHRNMGFEATLRAADEALYRAKAEGRDRIRRATSKA